VIWFTKAHTAAVWRIWDLEVPGRASVTRKRATPCPAEAVLTPRTLGTVFERGWYKIAGGASCNVHTEIE
jgi:hypothetical protein